MAFKDLNNDGYRDILVTGVAISHDDKEDKVLGEANVRLQYEYSPYDKKFKKTITPALDFVELNVN
jgi:hypothetical protein